VYCHHLHANETLRATVDETINEVCNDRPIRTGKVGIEMLQEGDLQHGKFMHQRPEAVGGVIDLVF
jgi:hypothetical protein